MLEDYLPLELTNGLIRDYADLHIEKFEQLDDYIPIEVCHFTRMEIALEKILPQRKLLFNKFGQTNDPREYDLWSFPLVTWGTNDKHAKPDQVENIANKVKNEEWQILCMTCHNNPSYIFIVADPITEIDHSRYGFSHSRIWAQYGENQRGVCLIFDGRKLEENLQKKSGNDFKIKHGYVRYDIEKSRRANTIFQNPNEKADQIRDILLKHYEEEFLYKSTEWKSEHEFRWLINTVIDERVDVSIDRVIKAVIVGANFPKVYEPSLKVLCKELGIPAGRMSWNKGMPFAHRETIYEP
jgi:hypothetical protein